MKGFEGQGGGKEQIGSQFPQFLSKLASAGRSLFKTLSGGNNKLGETEKMNGVVLSVKLISGGVVDVYGDDVKVTYQNLLIRENKGYNDGKPNMHIIEEYIEGNYTAIIVGEDGHYYSIRRFGKLPLAGDNIGFSRREITEMSKGSDK